MLKRDDYAEKRQFGRRPSDTKAWVRVHGRPAVPCTLANISDGGALVLLEEDTWLPYSFRLTSDDKAIDRIVEIRHQQGRRIGVEFVAQATSEEQERLLRKRVDEFDAWIGTIGR